jgi:hypothetical protein
MKKLLTLAVVAGLVLSFANTAAAAEGGGEISLFGNYLCTNLGDAGGKADDLGVGLGLSTFISDTTSVGLQGLMSWGDDFDLYSGAATLKYHFGAPGELRPYVGFLGGYGCASDSGHDDGWIWGPLAGFRFPLCEGTDMFAEYQYTRYERSLGDVLDESNVILIGFIWQY